MLHCLGFTAKAWREANPELAAQKGLASVSMSMIADKMNHQEEMMNFYKVIYSERPIF